jgi:hypothetical protein
MHDVTIACACRLKPGLQTAWRPGFSRLDGQSLKTLPIAFFREVSGFDSLSRPALVS